MKVLDEAAELLIAAKGKTDQINDAELNYLVEDILIRLGKLLAREIIHSSSHEETPH